MKKLIVLFWAAVLCFSLGVCGDETQTSNNITQKDDNGMLQGTEQVSNQTGTSQSQITSSLTAVFEQFVSVMNYGYTVYVLVAGDGQSDEQTLLNQTTIDENQYKYIERDSKGEIINIRNKDSSGRVVALINYSYYGNAHPPALSLKGAHHLIYRFCNSII